jgi:hypothetical protein
VRIRSLKPGFFKNEELAELSPWHRLCFQGLWCYADRDGRMMDRPKRLKAEIFPYDDLHMDMLLWDLQRAGFIVRYAINGTPLIWIPTFHQHQHPRQDEADSLLAPYVTGSERLGGPGPTTFPAVRPIETDPSLPSDDAATTARIVTGVLDLGTGNMGDTAAVAAPPFRAQDLIDLWNATTKPPIPRCRELTPDRRSKIRSRIARRPILSEWREGFEAIQAGAFYRGENDRQWTADFDWVIKNDTVLAKVLERAQTSRAPQQKAPLLCPHTPECPAPGRWACQQKTATEAYKASQGVTA